MRLPRLRADAAILLPTLILAVLLAAVIALGIGGCAGPQVVPPAPRVSLLPPDVDVEKLVPPVAPEISVGPDATRFQTEAISGGRYCEPLDDGTQDCRELRAGFVLSEATYVEAVQTKSNAKRLAAEAGALRTLRASERAAVGRAEQAYWQRIASLEQVNAALQRTQRSRFWLGLVLGVAATAGAVLGAAQIAR